MGIPMRVGWRPNPSSLAKLLDTYTSSTGAYGLRKLNSAYSGPVITVRRSVDNTSTDIGFTANGELDTAALFAFVGYANNVLYSDYLSTTSSIWSHLNGSVNSFSKTDNVIVAPDGTTTATRLVETAANNIKAIQHAANASTWQAGTSWNASVHVKQGTGSSPARYFALTNNRSTTSSASDVYAVFDIQTGTVTQTQFGSDTNTGTSMTDLGNGWWRCSMWGTSTVSASRINATILRLTNNSPNFTYGAYVGNVNRDIYVWGYQYTAGTDTRYLTLKPYTKTTTNSSIHGYVTIWHDQSGTGRNLTQTTAAQQPYIIYNGFVGTLNNKNSIFYGGTQGFSSSGPAINDTNTILTVFKMDSSYLTTGEYQILGGPIYDYQCKISVRSNKYFISNNSTNTGISSTVNASSSPVISSTIFSTTDKFRLNGTEIISGNVGSMTSGSSMVGRGYLGRYFLGNISEMIIWNSALTSTVSSIESACNTYYQIY